MRPLNSKPLRRVPNRHAHNPRLLACAWTCIAVAWPATVCLAETATTIPLPSVGYCAGDADRSGRPDLNDVVYLVNYVFKGGPEPEPYYLQGDATCDGWVDARDIVALVSYWHRERSLCDFCASVFPDSALLLEAQIMAMWYANTLEPPMKLTKRFLADLHRIRTELTEADPALDGLSFAVTWGYVSVITVSFDSITAHQIRDSSYHGWDSLNECYGLTSVTEHLWYEGLAYWLTLQFSGVKNPSVLASAYGTLPGAEWASAGGTAGAPETDILPRVHGDTVAYLLLQGWGDCMVGCGHTRYYYVRGTSDSLRYLGRWPTSDDWSEPKPTWWPATCEHLRLRNPYLECE